MDTFPISISFSKSIGNISDLEVNISPSELLVNVSKVACRKAGINFLDNYILINASNLYLSMENNVEYNKVSSGDHLILTKRESSSRDESNEEPIKNAYQDLMWKPLAIVAIFLSIGGLIVLFTLYFINLTSIYTYSVVIDAGSTSSKIYLYKWASNKFLDNANVKEVMMCKTNSSISSYAQNANDSFKEIKECLDKNIITQIPSNRRTMSLVYLGATAGMRMLHYNNLNATKQIMDVLRDSLKSYSLKVNNSLSDIKIITGAEEGRYGWITVNYLKKSLSKINAIGALDMGGASTEITFLQPTPDNSTDISTMKLFGESYSIYSHSYLCFGKFQAEFRFIALLIEAENFSTSVYNPCMSKGQSYVFSTADIFNVPCVMGKFALDHYGHEIIPPEKWLKDNQNVTVNGTSNSDNCKALVSNLFNDTSCYRRPCTFNGIYQPPLSGNFGAFSAYNLIKTNLNKDNSISELKDYQKRLTELCNSKFIEQQNGHFEEDIWTKWKCFDLMYMIEILIRLGFNESQWKNLVFYDKIGDSNVGWGLGFMIDKSSVIPKEVHFLPIDDYLFYILLVVLLIILIFGFIFIYFLRLKQKRNKKYAEYPALIEEENLLS